MNLPNIASNPFLREYIESEELAEASSSLNATKATLATINSDQNAGEVQVAIARQQVTVAETSMESLKRRWDATRTKLSDEATAANLAVEAANAERIFHFQDSLLELLKQRDVLAKAEQSNQSDAKKKKAAIDAAKKKLSKAEKTLVDASANLVATDGNFTPVGTSYPTTSSGRRTALADWITNPHNPLTARVAINHIWLHYFGEPLVQSVDDFGLRAPPPVHQKVLDWLAVELMEHQWSMKHIHRLILNSRLYRVTSSATPTSVAAFADNSKMDPDNLHIWRANIRRLNAEQVRDSLLAVAGTLDRTMGGADIDFREGETVLRRSLYFRHAYEKQMRMLVVFDAANPTDCYRRSESVVPQQSLALANSPLAIDQSRRAAARVSSETSDNSDFIQRSFAVILGRQATREEKIACERFLNRQTQLLSEPTQLAALTGTAKTTVPPASDATGRARENLIHVLVNHNDFVTVR